MEKKYVVKIEIFDNFKYTIDLYSETEFENKFKCLYISEKGKDIYYEYFNSEEDAKKYINKCKNKVYYKSEEQYLDCGMCCVCFSTIQLPKKPKDTKISGSTCDVYSCFFDTKEDFMRYIEEQLDDWEDENFSIENETDLDIDFDI